MFNPIELLLTSPLVGWANRNGYVRLVTKQMEMKRIPSGEVVRYGAFDEQAMEVAYPTALPESRQAPALVHFHGGGFVIGGRELGRGIIHWASRHGMVGISVGYALAQAPRWEGTQTAVSDALLALDYIRAHHDELGIDAQQIVCCGESAGGAVALMASQALRKRSQPVRAVVAAWPMCTFDARWYIPQRVGWGGWRETSTASLRGSPCILVPSSAADPQQTLRDALTCFGVFGRRSVLCNHQRRQGATPDCTSFVVNCHEVRTPTLLLCAENDVVTPCVQQTMFAEIAKVDLAVFEGVGHGEGGLYSTAGRRHILDFLRKKGRVAVPTAREHPEADACMDAQAAALGLGVVQFHPRPRRPWERFMRFRRAFDVRHCKGDKGVESNQS